MFVSTLLRRVNAACHTRMLMHAAPVQAGLKTGMYYLRTRAAADAIKFTVDQQAVAKNRAARQNSAGAGTPAPAAIKALPVIEAPIGFTPTPELKVRVFN